MAKAKKGGLSAFPLGGLGEIGMNMMAYECDNEMIIVDVGITFPAEYEPGADVVVPDIRYVRDNIHKLKAIVITHAHEDHIGALPYLWEELGDVPVYLTKFAHCILEGKLSQLGLESAKRCNVVEDSGRFKVGKFDIEYIGVTHSIPEGNALCIRTPYGNLLHTGDFKLDKNPVIGQKSNLERLKEIGKEGVLAMLCDSTNVFVEGDSGSEGDLADSLDSIIGSTKNKIFFATFSSNLGRLLRVAEIATAHGRKVCFLSRSSQKMVEYGKQCGYFPSSLTNNVVTVDQAKNLKKNKVFYVTSGTQGEGNANLSFLAYQGNFKGISIDKDDMVLLSSKMIPGNERNIYNLINKLLEIGAHLVHEKSDFVHVSGHAGRDELKEMYAAVKPDICVPVHGEYAHLYEHAKLAKSFGIKQQVLITNGQKLHLAPEEPFVEDMKEYVGRNYVDGLNILDEDRFILRERRHMNFNGLAVASVVIEGKSGKVLSDPIISSKGVIDATLQPEVVDDVVAEIRGTLAGAFEGEKITNIPHAEEMMRQAMRRAFNRERGRKPVAIAQVIEV